MLYSTPRPAPPKGAAAAEVVGEVRERATRVPHGAFESLANAKMELGSPHPGQAVVQRPTHELVGEAVGEPTRGKLLEHPATDGLVEGCAELGLPESGRAADDVELELRSGRRCELEQIRRRGRKTREPLADDLANALRADDFRRRPRDPDHAAHELDGAGLDERAPELANEERVPLGEVVGCLGELAQLGAEVAAGRGPNELGNLGA